MCRAQGIAQEHAEALTILPLRWVIDVRDRALLLVGFGAALRCSELVTLDHNDVAVVPEGLRVTIRRSKGNQAGALLGPVEVWCP